MQDVCVGWLPLGYAGNHVNSLCGGGCGHVLMLEAANYVQHYGLQRCKLDNGRSAIMHAFCGKQNFAWLNTCRRIHCQE